MTGRAEQIAAVLVPLLMDHRLTTPIQCACGWRENDPLCAGTWPGHVAAAVDAVLAAQEGGRGGADTTTAAVEAVVVETLAVTPPPSSSQIDAGIRAADRAWAQTIRAALSDPVGALAKHDAEVLRAAAEEWPGLNDAGGNVYRWLRERADRIEGNQP